MTGGGSFSGDNGYTTKNNMVDSLTEAYEASGNSELLERLNGLYLWGCYTTVPGEVKFWKRALPNVQFLVGFHGSGPSNTNATGIAMLRSALQAQKRVRDAQTLESLKSSLQGIRGINTTLSGVFVDACEQLEDQYYYSVQKNYQTGGLNREFSSFSEYEGECDTEIFEFRSGSPSREQQLSDYLFGFEPIPEETSGTPLRSLYNYMRHIDHCLNERTVGFSSNQVGALLFFHDVKKNFSKVFESEIAAAASEFELAQNSLNSKADEKTKLHASGAWLPTLENIQSKSRKEILENMGKFNMLIYQHGVSPDIRHLMILNQLMENYLNYVGQNGMEFLDWHEFSDVHTPITRVEHHDSIPQLVDSQIEYFQNAGSQGGYGHGQHSGYQSNQYYGGGLPESVEGNSYDVEENGTTTWDYD